MKYLVLIIVVLVLVWLVRGGARRTASERDESPRKAAPPGAPQEMVECAVCRVHLPRSDALPGPNGQLYCCVEHRGRAGG